MIYLIVWLLGMVSFFTLIHAANTRQRADEAYELAIKSMQNHVMVAEDLAEHHDRLVALEPAAANDESYGGTDSKEFPLL